MRGRYRVAVRRDPEPVPPAAPAVTRGPAGFGGIVPCSADVRAGSVLIAVLGVELHADGAAVPLLILSDVPGLLRWDAGDALAAEDDVGTRYAVTGLSRQSGLGAMTATVWLVPEVPPQARSLRLTVSDVVRLSVPRGGTGVERVLSGGPWELEVDLVPARTAVAPPPEVAAPAGEAAAGGVPVRALDSYGTRIPVGQARIRGGTAVCPWSIERYGERSVLTLGVLHDADLPDDGREVALWDDRGRSYRVQPLQEVVRDGWTEVSVTVVPGIDPDARALGLRVDGVLGDALPAVFGVAVPA